MRLPVVGNISTKDGATNKNARLTNMLAEQKKNGTTLATVRPGLSQLGTTTGVGNGLVCFGGELVSVYESNMGIWNILDSGLFHLGGISGGDGYGIAYGCSSDASVIVGSSHNSSAQDMAFRWTSSGLVNLGTLGGNASASYATNSDGSVVVGTSKNGAGQYRAFRWTSGGGMVDLGTLGGTGTCQAWGVSSDGSVVVGVASTATSAHAFRWTSGGGMVDLGTLGGISVARGCSADGSIVVGYSNNGTYNRAFRWTSGGGMVDLGTPTGYTESQAYGISGNGNVIVGQAYPDVYGYSAAFKWTSGDTFILLDELVPIGNGIANCASYDGNVIFGATSGMSATWRMVRWVYPIETVDWGNDSDQTLSSVAYFCDYYGDIVVGYSENPDNGDIAGPIRNSFDEIAIQSGITTVTDDVYDFALIP